MRSCMSRDGEATSLDEYSVNDFPSVASVVPAGGWVFELVGMRVRSID